MSEQLEIPFTIDDQTESTLAKIRERLEGLDAGAKKTGASFGQMVSAFANSEGAKKLSEGLGDVLNIASKSSGVFESMAGSMVSLGSTAFAAAGGPAAVGIALKEVSEYTIDSITKFAEFSERLEQLSIRTDMSVEGLQSIGFAAQVSGSSMEGAAFVTQRLQMAIESNSKYLTQMGLDLKNLKAEDAEKQLQDFAKAINELPHGEQIEALKGTLGRFGVSQLPFLEGLAEKSEEAKKLGIVIGQDDVAAGAALNDQFEALDAVTGSLWKQFGAGATASGDLQEQAAELVQTVAALGPAFKLAGEASVAGFGGLGDFLKMEFAPLYGLAKVMEWYDSHKGESMGAAIGRDLKDALGMGEAELPDLVKGTKQSVESQTKPKDMTDVTIKQTEADKVALKLDQEIEAARAKSIPGIDGQIKAIELSTKAKIASTQATLVAKDGEEKAIVEMSGVQAKYNTLAAVEIQNLRDKEAAHQKALIASALERDERRKSSEALKISNQLEEQERKSNDELAMAYAKALGPIAAQKLAIEQKYAATMHSLDVEERELELTGKGNVVDQNRITVLRMQAEVMRDLSIAQIDDAETMKARSDNIALANSLELKFSESQRATATALNGGTASLQSQKEAIDAQVQAKIAQINKDLEGKEVTDENIAAAAALADQYVREGEAEKRLAEQKDLVNKLAGLAGALGALNGLLGQLGVSADSAFGQIVSAATNASDVMQRTAEQGFLSWGDMAKTVGDIFQSKSPLQGAIQGGMIGSMFGPLGAGIGAAVGGLTGFLGKIFGGKSEQEKAAEDVASNWGVSISKGLQDSIAKTASELKIGRNLAELLNMDQIMGESGKDPRAFANKLNDLMNAVKTGAVPAAAGITEIGKSFTMMQQASEAAGVVGDATMRQLIDRAKQLGENVPEIQAYIQAQHDAAAQGAKDIAAGMAAQWTSTAKGQDWAIQGKDAALFFGYGFQNEMADKGIIAALDDMGDQLKDFYKKLVDSGDKEGAKILAPWEHLRVTLDKTTDGGKQLRGSLEALGGMDKVFKAMANTGDLTKDGFEAMERSIAGTENGLNEAGIKGKDAMAAIFGPLKDVVSASEQYGFKLDDNTQKLVQQAKDMGYAFPQDPMLKAADAMTRVADALEKVLGISHDVGKSFDQIGDSSRRIQIPQGAPPGYQQGGGAPPGAYTGAARGGFFPATPGGWLVNLAEAGKSEFVVPEDVLRAMLKAKAGPLIAGDVNYNIRLGDQRQTVDQQIIGMLKRELGTNTQGLLTGLQRMQQGKR